jgi:hypothetical protein
MAKKESDIPVVRVVSKWWSKQNELDRQYIIHAGWFMFMVLIVAISGLIILYKAAFHA